MNDSAMPAQQFGEIFKEFIVYRTATPIVSLTSAFNIERKPIHLEYNAFYLFSI